MGKGKLKKQMIPVTGQHHVFSFLVQNVPFLTVHMETDWCWLAVSTVMVKTDCNLLHWAQRLIDCTLRDIQPKRQTFWWQVTDVARAFEEWPPLFCQERVAFGQLSLDWRQSAVRLTGRSNEIHVLDKQCWKRTCPVQSCGKHGRQQNHVGLAQNIRTTKCYRHWQQTNLSRLCLWRWNCLICGGRQTTIGYRFNYNYVICLICLLT